MPGSTRKLVAATPVERLPIPVGGTMTRKTRLMSKSGVMLVCVEIFDDGILRSTAFKVSTASGGQTFTAPGKAIQAFRAMSRRRPAEAPRLKTAA